MKNLLCAFLALFAATTGIPAADGPAASPPAESRNDAKVTVEFSFRPNAREAAAIREVTVAGDFNDWSAFAHPLARGSDGVFRASIVLKAGPHQWRFVLNGAWVRDMQSIAGQCTPRPETFANHGSGGRNAQNVFR